VSGFFSEEVGGNTMTEFCTLSAKSYAYNILYAGEEDEVRDKNNKDKIEREKIKAMGVRQHVVKNQMTLEDYKKCLFGEAYKKNVSIQKKSHIL